MHRRLWIIVLLIALPLIASPAAAQDDGPANVDGPPFALPFTDPPGLATWLYQQHYGNTTQAFNFGDVWYEFGQGLHFGVDFQAPCGTPMHAIADGVVAVADATGFGAGPHNLVLDHPGTGYSSLYGHLFEQSTLVKGQQVRRGDVIGFSGDPDGSCESRPHLHLEIRSANYQIAYNPLPFFDVDWHMLTSLGLYNNNFQQDLATPHRWMRLEDQPQVEFSGNLLNNYLHPWPLRLEIRAPLNPPPFRALDPLSADATVSITPVSTGAWNVGAWWSPGDTDAVYVIDALPGQGTVVLRQPLNGGARQFVEFAPPTQTSPDGTITVTRQPSGMLRLTRGADGAIFDVDTGGVYPAVSPDGTRILYELVYGEIVPGTSNPSVVIWASAIDGTHVQRVYSSPGIYSMWLDDHRVLIVQRVEYRAESRLLLVDLDTAGPDGELVPQVLGAYDNLSGLQIAPGGGQLAFFLPFQDDPAHNGVYIQATQIGSTPQKLPFVGAYQWRDEDALFVLSYGGLDQSVHALGVIEIASGAVRWLTDPAIQPIRVANGEWSVSPDGTRIVFLDPADYGLYMITVVG